MKTQGPVPQTCSYYDNLVHLVPHGSSHTEVLPVMEPKHHAVKCTERASSVL